MKRLLFALLTTALYAAAAGQIQQGQALMDDGTNEPEQITIGTTYSVSEPSTGELVIPVVTDASFLDMINDIKEDTPPMDALLAFIICLSGTTTAAQENAVNFYNNLTPAQRNNQLASDDVTSAKYLHNTLAPTYWAIYQQFSDNQKQLFFTAIIETVSNWTPPAAQAPAAILSGVGTPVTAPAIPGTEASEPSVVEAASN